MLKTPVYKGFPSEQILVIYLRFFKYYICVTFYKNQQSGVAEAIAPTC